MNRRYFAGLVLAGLAVGLAPLPAVQAQTTRSIVVKSSKASGPACGNSSVTTVAAMNNTKYAAVIKVYEAPDAPQPKWSLGVGLEIKGAVVFTVIASQGDWLNVNVPVRPNGSTGWVRKSDVHTFQHRYSIRVDTTNKRMVVCNAGKPIQTESVAVGKASTPTPLGTCYTVDLLKPKGGPNGSYGAFAIGLSCFSEVPSLENFGGGDGRVGIHGTNAPKLLGTAASHGCVRVSNAGITKMARTLTLGVPVEMFA